MTQIVMGPRSGCTRLGHRVGGTGTLQPSETAVSALSVKQDLEMRVRGLGRGPLPPRSPSALCNPSQPLRTVRPPPASWWVIKVRN